MCVGRPCAVCLQNEEVRFAVSIGIGHAELGIFPGRLDEIGFAGEERRGFLRDIRLVENGHNRATAGGVDVEEQVEVAVAIDIRKGNVAVVCEVACEQSCERLFGEDALAVVEEKRGFAALEIHAQDIRDTVVIEIRNERWLRIGDARVGGNVAEVERTGIGEQHHAASGIGGEEVLASIVVKVLDRDDVVLGQVGCRGHIGEKITTGRGIS